MVVQANRLKNVGHCIRGSLFTGLAFLCALVLIATAFFALPQKAFADESQTETVRVGWYQSDNFQEGSSATEEKSGYCYDYLQKVSDYTLWNYEYFYGDWNTLFGMLQRGEIDFLAGVSQTEERMLTMSFPDSAMGTDQYYIYKHAADDSISLTDLSTLNGKKVGGIRNNRATTFTEQWIEKNGLDVQVVYYNSFEEQEAAFDRGELDLMSQTINNVLSLTGITIVSKVGEEPFYLAVSKNRPDLLKELNSALTTMLSVDPFLLESLQYSNYGATLTSRTLTSNEKTWIQEHPVITVGYLDNYLPYSSKDAQGKATGLMTDVLDAIIDSLGLNGSLSVRYEAYSTYDEMMNALKNGKVDVVFPVYGDLWLLEQDGIDASSAVVSNREAFFYKGSYDKDQVKVIAVNSGNNMQIAYCKKVFPDAELLQCSSIEDCLQAVLDGRADGTVVNSLRTQLVTGNTKYRSLSYVQLNNEESRCFGVRANETELLLLLNRGLKIVGGSYGLDNSYKYLDKFVSYSAMDFVSDNLLWIVLFFAVIIAVVVSLLVYNLHVKSDEVKSKAAHLEEVNLLNDALEERQAQLEDAAVRQEAHLKEVAALNDELEIARDVAESANAAKTSFLFNMSHDIRTPMNAIMGFTRLLEKYKDDPEKCEDYRKKIQVSSEVLLSIINNVLEMARIEKGAVEIQEEPWQGGDLIRSLESTYSPLMKEKGIAFSAKVNVEHDAIYCDAVKVREVFDNLLSNAYKYTKPGGSVSLQLDEIPSIDPERVTYRVVVADTGVGMSAEYLPHLFEEFSREKTATESHTEGTGLGMPIVKRLVELMGGTIEVESQKGVGTTFTVTLSHRIAASLDVAEQSNAEINVDLCKDKCILLAEDNDLNAEIAIEILGEIGLSIERAKDGVEAVEMLANAPKLHYDLVLMDIQMPNMNGYEATRAIRKFDDRTKASIPIFAMTANAFEEDKREAMRAGMDGHIAKPIDIEVLLRALTEVFS